MPKKPYRPPTAAEIKQIEDVTRKRRQDAAARADTIAAWLAAQVDDEPFPSVRGHKKNMLRLRWLFRLNTLMHENPTVDQIDERLLPLWHKIKLAHRAGVSIPIARQMRLQELLMAAKIGPPPSKGPDAPGTTVPTAPSKKATGKKRRSRQREPRPFTDRQTEVMRLFSDTEGNFSAMARAMKLDRTTVKEIYKAAKEKAALVANRTRNPKPKKAFPRFQEEITDPETERPDAKTKTRKRF